MRAPFTPSPTPRIRAVDPSEPRVAKAAAAPASGKPQPGGVFREFVATLERLEKSKRRRKSGPKEG